MSLLLAGSISLDSTFNIQPSMRSQIFAVASFIFSECVGIKITCRGIWTIFWCSLTQGTDITEAFETSHVFGVPASLLAKYKVR
jgi:hypothetical protein